MDKKRTLLICGAILVAGVLLTTLIFTTEPTAKRVAATRRAPAVVDVVEVQRSSYRPAIVAMGSVKPAEDVTLSPRVAGEVVERSPAFTPGGFVEKGDILLKIDPADYRNRLSQARSDLRQMIADLNIEMGRQNVAQKDYQLLDETLSKDLEALVLRQPQLNAARAKVEAARAAVVQAELELERTNIRAPFDAHIISRNVNVGSLVRMGDDLGRIVGQDTYWVEATVPLSKLKWLHFPTSDSTEGAPVRIRNRTAWDEDTHRTGNLYRLIGALEDRTRLARVLVSVSDPLSHRPESEGQPPLMIGTFVETTIQAAEIPGVIRVSRDHIRSNNTVWVMENGLLRIRPVEIVFQDSEHAYISRGLEHGEKLVITGLASVRDGNELRERDTPSKGGDS